MTSTRYRRVLDRLGTGRWADQRARGALDIDRSVSRRNHHHTPEAWRGTTSPPSVRLR